MEKSKVYFTKEISSQKVLELFKLLNKKLDGKVAVKVHSGEKGNKNFLHPLMYKDIVDYVNGTIVECNTAYGGARNTTKKHAKLLEEHEWSKYFDCDILDSTGDLSLKIDNGIILKENLVGKNMENYDSLLVVSHFKGHPMGGYGGALKQLSIGCASSNGKANIHSAGKSKSQLTVWMHAAKQEIFLESMADAAKTVVDYFKGNIAYISILANLSVDCDCVSNAEAPCMKDIGIVASLDPVAIDQACIDLVKNSNDLGRDKMLERINSRLGTHTIDMAEKIGIGSKDYELIEIK